MGLELPQAGRVFIPEVPSRIERDNPELANYLRSIRRAIQNGLQGFFSNDDLMTTAINSGTSGTFTISSGGSIIVSSGIVVTVTS